MKWEGLTGSLILIVILLAGNIQFFPRTCNYHFDEESAKLFD